jgi:hypothetical protein
MVNGTSPIEPREWLSLRIRDGDDRHFTKLFEHRDQIWDVQPTVQSGELKYVALSKEWKMEIVSMKVN